MSQSQTATSTHQMKHKEPIGAQRWLSTLILALFISPIAGEVTFTAIVATGTSRSSCDVALGFIQTDSDPVFVVRAGSSSNFAFYNGRGYDCPKYNPDEDGPQTFEVTDFQCEDQHSTLEICIWSGDDNRATITCSGSTLANGLNGLNDLGCKQNACKTIDFEEVGLYCYEGECDNEYTFPLNAGDSGDKTYTTGVTFELHVKGTCPTPEPTDQPTISPSFSPSVTPTQVPSVLPTLSPTYAPSISPSQAPSLTPTTSPTFCGANYDQCGGLPAASCCVEPFVCQEVNPEVSLCLLPEETPSPTTDIQLDINVSTATSRESQDTNIEDMVFMGIIGAVFSVIAIWFLVAGVKKRKKRVQSLAVDDIELVPNVTDEIRDDGSVYFDQDLIQPENKDTSI